MLYEGKDSPWTLTVISSWITHSPLKSEVSIMEAEDNGTKELEQPSEASTLTYHGKTDWKRNAKMNRCRMYQQIWVMTCLLHGPQKTHHTLGSNFSSPSQWSHKTSKYSSTESALFSRKMKHLVHGKPLLVQRKGFPRGTVCDAVLKNSSYLSQTPA